MGGFRSRVNPDLLAALLDEDFFQLPPPKSTGRKLLNCSLAETKNSKIAAGNDHILPAKMCKPPLAELPLQALFCPYNNIQTTLPYRFTGLWQEVLKSDDHTRI